MADQMQPAQAKIASATGLVLTGMFAIGLAVLLYTLDLGEDLPDPGPLMLVLFYELTTAIGVLFCVLATEALFPNVELFRSLREKSGRHLAIAAILASIFVALLIASGIAYALGWL